VGVKREGHLVKTPENEKLIHDMANDPECFCGPDDHGHHWYGKILEDGRQAWAEVRGNIMESWGINEPGNIRTYNSRTGFKTPKTPSQKTPKTPSQKTPKLSGKKL